MIVDPYDEDHHEKKYCFVAFFLFLIPSTSLASEGNLLPNIKIQVIHPKLMLIEERGVIYRMVVEETETELKIRLQNLETEEETLFTRNKIKSTIHSSKTDKTLDLDDLVIVLEKDNSIAPCYDAEGPIGGTEIIYRLSYQKLYEFTGDVGTVAEIITAITTLYNPTLTQISSSISNCLTAINNALPNQSPSHGLHVYSQMYRDVSYWGGTTTMRLCYKVGDY